MRYNDNYQRELYDPSTVEESALDDRNRSNENIDEQDAFNNPEDRVAHL
jgi:hypothetical protein